MSEIYLDCDSPCVACPFGRVMKVTEFYERDLQGKYYCVNCGILTLCRRGIGFRMVRGKLRPFCPRCDRELGEIMLSYGVGKESPNFGEDILLVVRRPLQTRFDIIKVLRGSFFKNLSEVLLYIYFSEGKGEYDIIRYRKADNKYAALFSGIIAAENIQIDIVATEEIEVPRRYRP